MLSVIQGTPRCGTAAAVVDGVVYVAGGGARGSGASVEAYDPVARTWSRCAPLTSTRGFAAAAAFDGKVYVFGGLGEDGGPVDVVEVYDPLTDTWSAGPPMERALGRLAAVDHLDNGIIVVGGIDADNRNSAKVRFFVPQESVWRDWLPALPSGRHGLGLVDADDGTERIFAIGGYDDSGPLATVDWWGVGTAREAGGSGAPDPVAPDDAERRVYRWQPGPPLLQARGFHGVARIGSRIYVVGGRCKGIPRTEILDLDAPADGWRQAAPLPKDLCRFSLVAWNGHLLAFGGETDFGAKINDEVLEYDPDADTWSVR